MGNFNFICGGKRTISMTLARAVILWFYLLVLHPGITRGFVVVVDKSSVGSSIRTAMTTEVPIGKHSNFTATKCETERSAQQNPGRGVRKISDEEIKRENFELLCPSSYPSKTFEATNLEISHRPIESENTHRNCDMQLLPLQKYHSRAITGISEIAKTRQENNNFVSIQDTAKNIGFTNSLLERQQFMKHDIPSLDFIYENKSRFQISKSSQVLLQEYHEHKEHCLESDQSDGEDWDLLQQLELRLRSKLRAECRASFPLDIREILQILYCDSHICVVNKPSGVLSVPGHRRNPSLANLVYDTIQPSSCSTRDDGSIDNIDQSVVHRLDMATSGIIVYALSKEALQKLHVTFRDRKVQKTYEALVEGHLSCGGAVEGEIDVALERDPTNPPYMRIAKPRNNQSDNCRSAYEKSISVPLKDINPQESKEKQHKFMREAPKPSMTTWSILGYEHDRNGKPLTRISLKPHTGRTHQLRVHTSQVLGTPIVGDDIYGSGTHDPNSILCLHARQLCIYHPITGAPMIFEADPPF